MKKYCLLLFFLPLFSLSSFAESVTDYLSLLKSTDSVTRMRAAQTVGNKKMKKAVPALISLLGDESPGVVINAIVSLGMLRDVSSVKPLIEAVEKSTYTAVKIMGAQTLGYFRDKKVLNLLRKLADSENPMLRAAACRSLGRVGDEHDVDKLMEKAEKDDSDLVKKVAVDTLGEMAEMKNVKRKRKAIEEVIKRAAKSKKEKIKRSAEKALKRLRREKQK